ncbi:uncharacterized protein LOC117430325 isoform X3 [Acipenser ruthenus]|uniref:uncharacterized protein LOC117430325 isoform X3 n=1 Tax=Acipenser ruthenus TaxID=7906 RepID=UPI0027426D27|nr:uncharacterized protein LOC117430325 isoform X3 [Acipenser ruthenus]XP_058857299.1 uncharacterized protein LOC117430325 isoform X3 [Acipenser ruthenus]XP_058857300.1 uncharacterized protein LOC117430325 isoform X3 [Acipenser ruthenus]
MSLIAVLVFAVVFSAVDGGRELGVRCLIHDEDYTECTWKETGRPDRNYTFQSRYRTGAEYAECPSYTQVEGYNVGCRLEYNSHMRFATFQVQLSSANNMAIWNKDINLKPLVKLYSPVNLTVVNSSSNGLYLYWDTSMSKSQCLESIVRYRSSADSAWQNSPAFTSQRYFNLPFADAEEPYEFQVKVRINEFCGTSDYWSDWSQPAYWGSNATSKGVRCLIHDEDYTECTWKETGRPDRNYTFQSRYRTGAEYAECPSYTQVEGYNVGCRLEYNSHMRFATFQVQLSSANNTAIWNKDIYLKPLVKLYSPVNLTVVNSSSNGLYLYWDTSMSKSQCLESIVRYRSSADSAWQNSPAFTSQRYFNLPFADAEEPYEFQVKVRINEFCGTSDYWSDWSQPAYWGSNATSKGVRCLIHDEDYTECTWKETGRPDRNYTFQSRYRTGAEYAECPSYTQVEGYNVGCRLEYNSHMRFATFQVQLSSANNTAIWNKDIYLKPLVKLYSPVNLTVVNSSSNGLYLYWDTSMSKSQCLESIVRYRSSADSAWQNSPAFTSQRYFNLPFADAEEPYEFQVKVRINEFCGTSDYWSDWSQPAYWGSNATSKGVRCLIHDEDYTECTWKETGRPDRNYTFQSRYRTGAEYAECPSYTQVEGYNVGCRLEYNSHMRFATFQVQLSSANNTAIWNKDIYLKPLVKLYSPVNLTVVNSSSNGLYLYWNTSMSKSQCLESIVRYRSSADSAWQNSPTFTSLRYFNLPFADAEELYEFQVKVRINEFCGTSDYWSDWSQPAYWGSNATSKAGGSTVGSG